MSRMFKSVTRTWHVYSGCRFNCEYCWARDFIQGRLKHLDKYSRGFEPTLHPEDLKLRFRPGDFVGVALMGDISFASPDEVCQIMMRIRQFPNTKFLFQSKNPGCFIEDEWLMEDNAVYGTTLETNRSYYRIGEAPNIFPRTSWLSKLPAKHKFVSIEPIMDFDFEPMVRLIELIKPEIVEMGADNYHHGLPEPEPAKVKALLEALRGFVPRVVEKEGLERLTEGLE